MKIYFPIPPDRKKLLEFGEFDFQWEIDKHDFRRGRVCIFLEIKRDH